MDSPEKLISELMVELEKATLKRSEFYKDKNRAERGINEMDKHLDSIRKKIAETIYAADRDLAYVIGRVHPDIEARYKVNA